MADAGGPNSTRWPVVTFRVTPQPFNRRHFLSATSLGISASLVSAGLAAESPARKRPLKKGYMLNTFPGRELSVLEKFRMLKAAGFEGVEPPSHMDQDQVLRARDATGLAVASVSCGAHSRMLANPSPDQRAKGVEGIQQALRDAKRYGAVSILVVPGGVTEKITYEQNWEWTFAGIRECVPLAEELGVKLAIENVWNNFHLSPLEAARYVDEFKSAAVGWHFDIGNVMFLGWPEQWIRILGKRIVTLHIKEYSRKKMNDEGKRKGFEVEYLEGDNNWPVIMRALDGIGFRGWGIAEPAWRPAGVEAAVRLKQISDKLEQIFAL